MSYDKLLYEAYGYQIEGDLPGGSHKGQKPGGSSGKMGWGPQFGKRDMFKHKGDAHIQKTLLKILRKPGVTAQSLATTYNIPKSMINQWKRSLNWDKIESKHKKALHKLFADFGITREELGLSSGGIEQMKKPDPDS